MCRGKRYSAAAEGPRSQPVSCLQCKFLFFSAFRKYLRSHPEESQSLKKLDMESGSHSPRASPWATSLLDLRIVAVQPWTDSIDSWTGGWGSLVKRSNDFSGMIAHI